MSTKLLPGVKLVLALPAKHATDISGTTMLFLRGLSGKVDENGLCGCMLAVYPGWAACQAWVTRLQQRAVFLVRGALFAVNL